ncbi:MAG: ATP-binding protein [Terrimicrobiaceae bacterium]
MPTNIRSQPDLVIQQALRISEWKEMREFMDAIPDMLVAVNSTRQIVFANKAALEFFHANDLPEIWGKRPGEVAGCIHSAETPGGCGDSDACKVCGAFRAMMRGLQGDISTEECRMTLVGGFPLDLRIWARPFQLEGERFVFLSIQDISDEKRRQILEKIFFHDLLNTAGGLQSVSDIMEFSTPEEFQEMRNLIVSLSGQLVDEILAQRELLAAERGELYVEMKTVDSLEAIDRVVSTYQRHQAGDGKHICVAEECDSFTFPCDSALLLRVLGNLAKNALEASPVGGEVTVGCSIVPGGKARFLVHNKGVIPRSHQLQIFNRPFSTKGNGRGLGTYSVKLLTERFLHGRAGFFSSEQEQTTFFVELPIKP